MFYAKDWIWTQVFGFLLGFLHKSYTPLVKNQIILYPFSLLKSTMVGENFAISISQMAKIAFK